MIGARIGAKIGAKIGPAIGISADQIGSGVGTFTFAGLAGAKPGQIYLVGENGSPSWSPNHPAPWHGQYNEFENGAAGAAAAGLHAFLGAPSGAGAARTVLQGEAGWFQNPCAIETGTATTGSYNISTGGAAGMSANTTTGSWVHEATWSVPVLSDGTNRYAALAGFNDNANAFLVQNGAYFRYRDDNNGGRLEFVTAAGGVRTPVDTGITLVAGSYYHTRVEIVNNTTARGWIKVIYDSTAGSPAFSDDGIWGAAQWTISTNIPSTTAQKFLAGVSILKSLGTTTRKMKVGYQRAWRTPPFAGNPLVAGDVGTCLRIDETGAPAWLPPHRITHPIVFYALGRGGFTPSGPTADMGGEFGGTGGTGSNAIVVLDNSTFGMTNLHSGTGAANGYAFWRTAYNLNIDATVQPMVIETVWDIPTLSTGVETFNFVTGIFDSAATAHLNGVTLELDTNANPHAVARCVSGGVATSVDTGLTMVAGTLYISRIVITSTSVSFYLKAEGAASFGAPVATITTNIPGLANMAAGLGVRKSAGTTSRNCQFHYCLAYQRSTTYAGAGSNAMNLKVNAAGFGLSKSTSLGPYQPGELVVMEDDNSGTPAAAPVIAFAMPNPRTHNFALEQSAHMNLWGSSDLVAGGDESGSDDTHPECWSPSAGGPPGHVGVGNAGGVPFICLSATSHVRYCDFNFATPVASTAAEKFNCRYGYANITFGTALTLPLPTNGVYAEIDADTNANMQFVCRQANNETRVDSGIAIAAGTRYRGRIVITRNTSVDFYLAAEGSPLPTNPNATIITNIPSGTGQALMATFNVEKTVGSGVRYHYVNHFLVGMDRYAA